MKPQSRYIIHIGINFVIYPCPDVTPQAALAFQGAILAHGLEFTSVAVPENKILVVRESPTPLEISVNVIGPQVGQILVVAPNPKRSIDLFIQEAEAAVDAFLEIWPASNRQVMKSDATIRELYETTSEHAFKELWENFLKQPSQTLSAFERPVRGGGMRFVLEPIPDEPDPAGIEIKIESFLNDTSKFFIETQFIWPKPTPPGTLFNVRDRLVRMNEYIEKQIHDFILGESK
jgi:hypothetical protein